MRRRLPNILIAGTPGTGKSTLSSEISEQTGLEWIDVGQLARDNDLVHEYDEAFESYVINEDKVVSELEDKINEGGKILDYHGSDLFPENWFDIVFVLRTNNTVLFDRLTRRGYNEFKIKHNIEAEIFNTLLDEAKEAYKPGVVHALESNTPEDMENNIEHICEWIRIFQNDHANR